MDNNSGVLLQFIHTIKDLDMEISCTVHTGELSILPEPTMAQITKLEEMLRALFTPPVSDLCFKCSINLSTVDTIPRASEYIRSVEDGAANPKDILISNY
jgi:hypothetical protein